MKNIIHDLNTLSADILRLATAFQETGVNDQLARKLSGFHKTTDRIYHELTGVHSGATGRTGYACALMSGVAALHRFVDDSFLKRVSDKLGEVWFCELKGLKVAGCLNPETVAQFWQIATDLWPGTFHMVTSIYDESVNPPDQQKFSKWDVVDIRIQPHNSVEKIQLWVVAHEP